MPQHHFGLQVISCPMFPVPSIKRDFKACTATQLENNKLLEFRISFILGGKGRIFHIFVPH